MSAYSSLLRRSAFLPALFLAGCMVGPEYAKPETFVPDVVRFQTAPPEPASFADLPWWTVFRDEELQLLVTEALSNNYDLRVTIARIGQARALVGVARSEGLPQIGYEALAAGQNELVPARRAPATVEYGALAGLLNVAWELDLWGRIRYATEAAEANLLAQEHIQRGVVLVLVSDVATGYFRLLELDRELVIAEESARVFKNTLDLFTARFNAGRDNMLPVTRAEAAYESSQAAIHDLKRAIAQQENAIGTLLGAYPREIRRGRALTEQVLPETPVGATTALLQRRPDILEAEQVMIGANAEMGIAMADFFPKLGLSAFFSEQGVYSSGNWADFEIWSIALGAAGPIYSGGRLNAIYRERQAFWDETVAKYRQTVLVAFRETSDALVARGTLTERRAALENQVQALQESSRLALLRYESGRASYFEVLEAQQQLFPAQDALAQTMRDELLAVVALYKALGGGWQGPFPPQPALPAPPRNVLLTSVPSETGE
jgi:multidrug efflux system outer membrane protein